MNPSAPLSSFDEVIRTYDEVAAVDEATRCLDCDMLCSTCDSVCPNRAIVTFTADELHLELPVLQWRGGSATVIGRQRFDVNQPYQVAVMADLCNECGNCTTFCPTSGRPHADKPRLYLDHTQFAVQKDNAFKISHRGGVWRIEGIFSGMRHLLVIEDTLRYQSPTVELQIDPLSFEVIDAEARDGSPPPEPVTLNQCAVLFTLFRGIRDSAPWIPVATNGRTD